MLSKENEKEIIDACESLQFLTFKTMENPLISSGLTLLDRTNYIDIQKDKNDNYIFKLDKRNRKYKNKMKKIFKTLQKDGGITIKNNGSIIVKFEKLDLFLQEVKSKRQDQKEKSKSKAAYTSFLLNWLPQGQKLKTQKEKRKEWLSLILHPKEIAFQLHQEICMHRKERGTHHMLKP